VSGKDHKVAALLEGVETDPHDPHFAGYSRCFNEQKFYEAHDVLEALWLQDRNGPDGDFFKGLIQFAGAFVHLQKSVRVRRGNCSDYAPSIWPSTRPRTSR